MIMSCYKDDVPEAYKQIAVETLKTLGLLVLTGDRSFITFRRSFRGYPIDNRAQYQPSPSRRVAEYFIWRVRLQRLERKFDSSFPRTLSGWWYDRRNRKDWITFWVAFAALVCAGLAFLVATGFTAYSLILGQQSLDEAKLANAYASNASTSAAHSTQSSSDPPVNVNNASYAITNCLSAACYFGNDIYGTSLIRSDSTSPEPTELKLWGASEINVVVTSTILAPMTIGTTESRI
ncbi:hypothetical protein F5Y13DRAFT_200640 [Hypoxylon sp. FL1857]|nr:hypothetical protein F5Y13DRAFT_200640 [Hypoxylon sp. FL1857]